MKKETIEHEPRPYRFTRKEYYAMGDAGLFENKRVELMDGEIILMSPQKGPHGGLTGKLTAKFISLVPPAFVVRCQLPLDLGARFEPEPDIVISKGTWDEFLKHHPRSAELVIEIANARANYDRKTKGSLYARARIPEFWLINLIEKRVEVFRRPVKAKDEIYGYRYLDRQDLQSGDSISPLCMPSVKMDVKELLP